MKNLATCTPTEFITQTAKIKSSVAKWLDLTRIPKIRSKAPVYKVIPKGATAEEKAEIIKENAQLKKDQALKNLNEMLDQILIEHPSETLEILALVCFVEPEHVDDHTMDEYMQCVMEMIQNKSVMGFFSLLAQIETRQTSI